MFPELFLAFSATISALAYFVLDRRVAKYLDWESPLDRALPLVPLFIIPYLAFIPYVALAFVFLFFTPYAKNYFLSFLIASVAADVFWYVFPFRVERAVVASSSYLTRLLNGMRRYNSPGNSFPSSHAFFSLITGYWLCVAFPAYAGILGGCALLIAVSILFVKQHYVIDLLGGLVWAATAIYVAEWILLSL